MNDHTDFDHHSLPGAAPPAGDSLDIRLARLENAIVALQDTRIMEERLLEKVSQRLDQPHAGADGHADSFVSAAGQSMLPGVIRAVGSQLDAATSPTAPGGTGSLFSARTWLLTDLAQEIRTFAVMYFDFRYRPSWPAKIIPPAALLLFVLSWIFLRSMAFIGGFLDYGLDFFLVVLVYKTLQREAARYRAHVAFLPPI